MQSEKSKTATKPIRIPGTALVPDLSTANAAISNESFYWVGALPDCPVETVVLAGVVFPKVNESIIADPMRTSQKKRVPVIGSLVRLNAARLVAIQEKLARTVVRFIGDEGLKEEPGTGLNMGDNHRRPRRGHLITIPTKQELDALQLAGRPARAYVPHPNDKPVAQYVFAQLCRNQEVGERGEFYPEPLTITGLVWPGED